MKKQEITANKYEWIRETINKPTFRRSKLYKLLKNELSKHNYWRNQPRGDAWKGYKLGYGKAKDV